MEFYTFVAKDTDTGNEYQLSVTKEFLEKCPDPEKQPLENLADTFNVWQYLHNTEAPALVGLSGDAATICEYFINGQAIMKDSDEWKAMKFNKEFKDGFDAALKAE